jgi:glucokinase
VVNKRYLYNDKKQEINNLRNKMKKKIGIGIDLGGSSIKYALGTAQGEILNSSKRPSHADETSEIIINEIAEAIFEMSGFAKSIGLNPSVIGIGTPGSVDVTRGLLKGSTPNFRCWHNIAIKDEIEKIVDLPVFVDNDANVMALGEAKFGAGIGHKNIVCLTVGTGIGGGIILNGELFRGSNFSGAELGHMTIKHDGRKCRCGGKGCLERYASASAMIDSFLKKSPDHRFPDDKNNINVKYIFTQKKMGNPLAREVIEKSTYYLGRGIANFINIFNPTIIIIGGGVAEAGKAYLKQVEDIAFQYAMDCAKENVKIVGAKLGNKAGYLGALGFACDQIN